MKKLTKEQFEQRANIVHNFRYDYSNVVYNGMGIKVKILCSVHGQFPQTPSDHLTRGSGCPKCSRKYKPSLQEFIEKSNFIHGNYYDYSKVKYTNCKTKLEIICPTHGSFWQAPDFHINRKQGCPICGIHKRNLSNTATHNEWLTKAEQVHGDMWDYSKSIYKGVHTKTEIICSRHGSFWQRPNRHLQGEGCPTCSNSVSKPETKWLDSQEIPNTPQNRQVSLNINGKNLCVDGYIQESNTVYEFWGDFWHGNPNKHSPTDIHPICHKTYGELYDSTLQKRQLIIDAGYNLVEIWESEWKKNLRGLLVS